MNFIRGCVFLVKKIKLFAENLGGVDVFELKVR